MCVASTNTWLANGMRTALATAVLLITLSALGDAQSNRGTMMRSGLLTYPQGHTARVTVVDVAESPVGARVLIELRDVRDQVVARAAGRVRAGQPLQLDLPISDVLAQLRVTVIVGPLGASQPSTTVEDVDTNSLSVVPKVYCGPPLGHVDAQPLCPGWVVTTALVQ